MRCRIALWILVAVTLAATPASARPRALSVRTLTVRVRAWFRRPARPPKPLARPTKETKQQLPRKRVQQRVRGPEAIVMVEQLAGPAHTRRLKPDSRAGGYHGTSTADPAQVMRHGLPAAGRDWRLDLHANPSRRDPTDKSPTNRSAFRGTTPYVVSPDASSGAALWAGEGGWVYEVRGVPTWDVNKALEGSRVLPNGQRRGNLMSGEVEFAIPARVPLRYIKRYGKVEMSARGVPVVKRWVDNPAFQPQSR